jgi:hypothetical protein
VIANRLLKLWRVLLRCACWLAALVAFVYLCIYVSDAHTRATRAPNCRWNLVSNPDNAPYSARFCYLTKGEILLRIHDGVDRRIAKRHYAYSDLARFYWEPNGLDYISDDRGSFIELPPTLLDRLRAKLP